MKLLRYGATTDRLRDPRGPAYSPDGQTRIRLGNEPAAVRHRKLWANAFEGPGKHVVPPPMSATAAASKRAARLKLERLAEAAAWVEEVKRRPKVAK